MSEGETTRYTMGGFWDTHQRAGAVRATNTPGNRRAIEKYRARQERAVQVGVWRCAPTSWKVGSGSYVDPDYYIVDWDGRVT